MNGKPKMAICGFEYGAYRIFTIHSDVWCLSRYDSTRRSYISRDWPCLYSPLWIFSPRRWHGWVELKPDEVFRLGRAWQCCLGLPVFLL